MSLAASREHAPTSTWTGAPTPDRAVEHGSRAHRWPDRLLIAAIAIAFAVGGWTHRWIADDGLIFSRVSRQIAAGNGPVTNVGERVEAATSTLWVWLLAGVSAVFGVHDPSGLAVYAGLALAIAGVVVALDACRRLHRTVVPDGWLLPAGALVLLVLPPFWDFASSGMETGLELAWAATWWWLLVDLWRRSRTGTDHADVSARRWAGTALVFGLGPLVRPDFALIAAVGLVAAGLLVRASVRRWLLAAVAACALPVAYEIFRLGFYGLPYPMPAAAKDASSSPWWRGWLYLLNYAKPYWLLVPAIACAVAAIAVAGRRRPGRPTLLVVGAPVVAALLEGLYVVRVGGDFMHGRMWLAPTLLALCPVLLVPARKATAVAAAALVVWAGVGVFTFGGANKDTANPQSPPEPFYRWVWDEHKVYVDWTGHAHPTQAAQHVDGDPALPAEVHRAAAAPGRTMVVDPQYIRQVPLPLGPEGNSPGLVIGRLGAGGSVVGLKDPVIDVWGLANPLGGFMPADTDAPAGHQKLLPLVWNLALYTSPSDDATILRRVDPGLGVDARSLRAARHTLRCGAVHELLEAERAPLTPSRFLHNLTGALSRTTIHIPANPLAAERKFCRQPG